MKIYANEFSKKQPIDKVFYVNKYSQFGIAVKVEDTDLSSFSIIDETGTELSTTNFNNYKRADLITGTTDKIFKISCDDGSTFNLTAYVADQSVFYTDEKGAGSTGTTDYLDLVNKPKINDVELTGNYELNASKVKYGTASNVNSLIGNLKSGKVDTTTKVCGQQLTGDIETIPSDKVTYGSTSLSAALDGKVDKTQKVNGLALEANINIDTKQIHINGGTGETAYQRLDYLTNQTETNTNNIITLFNAIDDKVDTTTTINNKALTSDIILDADDLQYNSTYTVSAYLDYMWKNKVPTSRTINGKSLTSSRTLSAEDIPYSDTLSVKDAIEGLDPSGKVPETRTINGKALTADIVLSGSDIAFDGSSTVTAKLNNLQNNKVQSTTTINGHQLGSLKYTINIKATEIPLDTDDTTTVVQALDLKLPSDTFNAWKGDIGRIQIVDSIPSIPQEHTLYFVKL